VSRYIVLLCDILSVCEQTLARFPAFETAERAGRVRCKFGVGINFGAGYRNMRRWSMVPSFCCTRYCSNYARDCDAQKVSFVAAAVSLPEDPSASVQTVDINNGAGKPRLNADQCTHAP
jgi:hypothetical protein